MGMTARGAARSAGDHPLLETGARVGYAANGLIHLLIAWIAIQVAFGGTSQEASETGALQQLAGTPLGSALLWVVAVGFALLALWQVTEAVAGSEAKERVKAGAKAAVYAALTWIAIGVVTGGSSGGSAGGGSSGSTSGMTAQIMQHAFGRTAVGLIGLVVAGVGVRHMVKGWREQFLEDLRERPGRGGVLAGKVGYVAKGVALVIVGALFVAAAATADPDKAQGLDGALRSLLELPFGKVLLTVVALGIAAYGGYSFVRARYARV